MTQVQGAKIDNVLNEKFVTPSCNGVGLTPVFCLGFQSVGVIGMVRDCFSLGVGAWRPEGVRQVVFHVEL